SPGSSNAAAFVPRDGESIGDLLPSEFRGGLEQLAAARPDRAVALPWELWRSSFMHTGDEPAARRAYARLVPAPWAPVFEPVRLSHQTSPTEAPAFVAFRHDRTMPPGYWHPRRAGRLAAPEIVELGRSRSDADRARPSRRGVAPARQR